MTMVMMMKKALELRERERNNKYTLGDEGAVLINSNAIN